MYQKWFAFGSKQVSAGECVDKAAGWAKAIVHHESRGPGDFDNAIRRVGRHIGISYSILWALRYRRPKDISASIFLTLELAYGQLRESGMQRVNDEIKLCEKARIDPAILRRIAISLGAVMEEDDGNS